MLLAYSKVSFHPWIFLSFLVAPVVAIQGTDRSWYVGQENVKFICSARSNPPARLFTWIRSVSPKTTGVSQTGWNTRFPGSGI